MQKPWILLLTLLPWKAFKVIFYFNPSPNKFGCLWMSTFSKIQCSSTRHSTSKLKKGELWSCQWVGANICQLWCQYLTTHSHPIHVILVDHYLIQNSFARQQVTCVWEKQKHLQEQKITLNFWRGKRLSKANERGNPNPKGGKPPPTGVFVSQICAGEKKLLAAL